MPCTTLTITGTDIDTEAPPEETRDIILPIWLMVAVLIAILTIKR